MIGQRKGLNRPGEHFALVCCDVINIGRFCYRCACPAPRAAVITCTGRSEDQRHIDRLRLHICRLYDLMQQ